MKIAHAARIVFKPSPLRGLSQAAVCRSDPGAMSGVHGSDAIVAELPEAIARKGVSVSFLPANCSPASPQQLQSRTAAAEKRGGEENADAIMRPSKRSRQGGLFASAASSHA